MDNMSTLVPLQQSSWLGGCIEYVAAKKCLSNDMKKDLLMLLEPDEIVSIKTEA